jgi:hypothetical protein
VRSAAGVEAQIGVVFGAAALEADIVADLEGEAIAVIVARGDIAKDIAVAVLDENAAGVVAVDFPVFSAVAVEDQVFYLHVVDPFGGEDGEDRRGGSVVFEPGVFLQAAAQKERLAIDAGDRVFDDFEPVVALGAEHDASTRREATGILDADLGFVPVGVAGEWDAEGRCLFEYGMLTFAPYGDAGAQVEGVIHGVFAGANFERAASQAVEIVETGLERLVVGACEIGSFGADAEPKLACEGARAVVSGVQISLPVFASGPSR